MKALTKERDELREAGNGTGNDWGCPKVWDMMDMMEFLHIHVHHVTSLLMSHQFFIFSGK